MGYREPEFLPVGWPPGSHSPCWVVTSGAGKTTLINELLARADRPIAVLVNDVGSVNIDAALIKASLATTPLSSPTAVCAAV